MNLREFQAKKVFAEHGIVVPRGALASTSEEVRKIAQDLDCAVVLKPQLGVKKRGKLGVIAFCDEPVMAEQEATRLFGMTVEGESANTLLVEERADIAEELYLAVTVDYSRRCPTLMISRYGGVDIEELSRNEPEKILRLPANILSGLTDRDIATIADFVDHEVAHLASTLYSIFRSCDAEMVEVNPLVRTKDGRLVAVDAVLNINDAALFRQPEMASLAEQSGGGDAIAQEANANKWTYIDLPGDIAILSSGAGLTMTILDLIRLEGGSAANFLDTAQIDDDGIYSAFELLARAKDARAMMINIFAGLNRCDKLAEGIVRYLQEHPYDKPVVVRMIGNAEEAGHRILRDFGVEPYRKLEEAVERVVVLARGT
ncbi:MAG: succinate--CoA ligase subunit beta [Gemmatimonadota bacterium]|nr:MAG: succinate--CoA ligase subunit beta [Gemmatimonadota bacterium]